MIDLNLKVMPDGSTAVGSILRTNQAYLELLSTKTTLEHGIAFCCTRFPEHRGEHQFREVWVESPEQVPKAFAAAEAHFAESNARCARWTLAKAQDAEIVEPFLTSKGFRREDARAYALSAWPDKVETEGVRVLPARPMRAAYDAVWREAAGYLPEPQRSAAVEAALERLDDHRVDATVATVGGKPAGIGTLFQVGDIGRLVDFYVLKPSRRKGVGIALLHHAIALARRLTLRIVCIEVSSANANAQAFLKKHNFLDAGRIIEFHRDDAVRPDYCSL